VFLQNPQLNLNSTHGIFEETPFSAACHNGHVEVVKELLKHPQVNVEGQ